MDGGVFRRAVIVVAYGLLVAPDLAGATDYVLPESLDPMANRPAPTMGAGRFLGCTAGGLVGGAMIAVACGGLAGALYSMGHESSGEWDLDVVLPALVGSFIGYPIGTAVCVYGAGSTGDVGGSFRVTLIGSVLGFTATAGFLWLANANEWSGTGSGTADWMLALVPTPVVATIAFAHTLRYDEPPPDAAFAPASRPDRLFPHDGAAGDRTVRVVLARREF